MRRAVPLALILASTEAALHFDWQTITPNRDLEYHDCYDGFQCARLELPLDYTNETDTRTAVIAITKLPAVVTEDDATFGGTIFVNPGGPGGSGVSYINADGRNLQRYVDKPGRRHYEILSWDPRGVGHTTPSSNCFHSDLTSRNAWVLEARGNAGLDNGIDAIKRSLSMAKAFSQRCEFSEKQWGDAMAYVNTPSVARDMVEMVDKIDELRKKSQDEPRLELKKRGKTDPESIPRLQYIGFSYGSALGNYFASLYPGRVGRMVLDGIVNADDYATGPGWLTSLHDTDQLLEEFWRGCHQAGPSICPLASSDGLASELKDRFWSWVASLDDSPLPTLSSTGVSVVITGDDIRRFVGISLYNPIRTFKIVAKTLDQAMQGNTTSLVSILNAYGLVPNLDNICQDQNPTESAQILPEAMAALVCGDGESVIDKDAAWWHTYVQQQKSKSQLFGAYWANIRFICSSWPFRANKLFRGPFGTPKAIPSLADGHPAAPLLFLNNRLDPVTPLDSARAMAAKHPGSGLVVQGSMGHCAIGTAPSHCTKKIVADYFESGLVPVKETTCETQCGPWDEECSNYSETENDALLSWKYMFK